MSKEHPANPGRDIASESWSIAHAKRRTLANGVIHISHKDQLLGFQYPNGNQVLFHADHKNEVIAVNVGDGRIWLRRDEPDTWLNHELEIWSGTLFVTEDGEVTFEGLDGYSVVYRSGVPVRVLQVSKAGAAFERLLEKLDIDEDQFLSEQELNKGLQNADITDDEAQVLAFLKICQRQLKAVTMAQEQHHSALKSIERALKNRAGIHSDTLKHLQTVLSDCEDEATSLRDLATRGAPFWMLLIDVLLAGAHSEKRLEMTRAEVDDYVLRIENNTLQLGIKTDDFMYLGARYIQSAFHRIDANDDGTINFKELWRHIRNSQVRTAYLAKQIELVLHQIPNRSLDAHLTLYAGKGVDAVTPGAVRQGVIGNCIFLAFLSSLAALRPRLIMHTITDNKNGTFTVNFPGASDEPILIISPTETELLLYAGAGKFGTWPAVLEKACGEFCSRSILRRSARRNIFSFHSLFFGSPVLSENSAFGGWEMFGSLEKHRLNKLTIEQFESMIIETLRQRKPAIVFRLGRETLADPVRRNSSIDDIRPNHAYGLISYDARSKTATIYNPWGLESNVRTPFAIREENHGFIKLSRTDLHKCCTSFWALNVPATDGDF